jgi:hypothetical protein
MLTESSRAELLEIARSGGRRPASADLVADLRQHGEIVQMKPWTETPDPDADWVPLGLIDWISRELR